MKYVGMKIVKVEGGYAVKRLMANGKESTTPYSWNIKDCAQDYIDAHMGVDVR